MNTDKIKSWLPWDEIEEQAQQQLLNVAGLSVIDGYLAVMPDCHFGKGATVGSVIPTYKAIIPAAVGVDIGCGMEAIKLDVKKNLLDTAMLKKVFNGFCRNIPLGAGGYHNKSNIYIDLMWRELMLLANAKRLDIEYFSKFAANQIGTLGSGNHFIELCLDQNEDVWLMLHSGSRGIGNRIGTHYIEQAKIMCEKMDLPDSDLSFFTTDSGCFKEYIDALDWAQLYAKFNRRVMLKLCLDVLRRNNLINSNATEIAVSCHHNYVEFLGDDKFLTRKGAISAKKDELGIIPGSMGTKSYIVRGKGNCDAHCSASHGAGRRMSRGEARRQFTAADLSAQTEGVVCRKDNGVVDEIPSAYKDIDLVIERQKDLIEVVYTLKQIMNVKG